MASAKALASTGLTSCAPIIEDGPLRGNSAALSAGLIIADVVGVGVLSMSVAVAKFGWALGALMIGVLLAMNVHISLLLWRVYMEVPRCNTLMELTRHAFAGAPLSQRRFIVFLCGAVQYVFLFMLLGLYLLSIGKGLGMIFYQTHICLPVWTLCGALSALPFLGTTSTLGKHTGLIWLNCTTIFFTVAIPLCVLAVTGVDATMPEGSKVHAITPFDPSNWLTGINTMSFAFTSQFMVVEIIAEMKRPAEFQQAYILLSSPFQGGIFLLAGLGGYYFKGDFVSGMIPDMIGFNIWFRVTAACLCVYVIVAFMIKGVVLCRAVHRALDGASASEASVRSMGEWFGIVAACTSTSWLVAQLVPFFTDLVDLLGSSLVPVGCYMVPILVFWRFQRDRPGGMLSCVSAAEWAVIGLEFALSIVMLFAGTYFAMKHIMSSWHKYGPPFACHCENIWDTCACSANHAGMELCLTS